MIAKLIARLIEAMRPKRDDPKRTTPAPSSGATPPSPGPRRDDPK